MDQQFFDRIRDTQAYQIATYDITMEDIVGSERFERIQDSKVYKFASDWGGLGANKVIIGMYLDSLAGLALGTSVMARGISLGFHSVASIPYTKVREWVYEEGNITPERSPIMRYGAELLAFNLVQTPLYVIQIAIAMGIHAALDGDTNFEPEVLVTGGFKFLQNTWWSAYAGKKSMDIFRRFFGSKTPEELATPQGLEELVICTSENK